MANRMLQRVLPRSNSTGGLPIAPSPSDSPGNLSLNILVKPDYVYLAGSHVDGYLEIDVQDTNLYLGDLGVELSGIEELRLPSHTSTKRLIVTRIDFQAEHLPPSNAVKPGSGLLGNFYLAYKGKTKFPFSFDLPPGLPSSCSLGNSAAIKYELRAFASISSEGVIGVRSEKEPITIVERWTDWRDGPWTTGAMQHASVPLKNVADGTLDMSVSIGKSDTCKGRLFWSPLAVDTHHGNETIRAAIRVRNNSKRDISGVRLSLLRSLRAVSKQMPNAVSLSQTVQSQDHHGVGYLFAAGKETELSLDITLPPKEAHSGRKGTLFELDCFLRVDITSSQLSAELAVNLPIWVAHPRSLPKAAHSIKPEATLALPTSAPFPGSRRSSVGSTSDPAYQIPYSMPRPSSAASFVDYGVPQQPPLAPAHRPMIRSETMPAVSYAPTIPSSTPILSPSIPFMTPLPSMTRSPAVHHSPSPAPSPTIGRARSPLPMLPSTTPVTRSQSLASFSTASMPVYNAHHIASPVAPPPRSRSPLPVLPSISPSQASHSTSAPKLPHSPIYEPVKPYSALERAQEMRQHAVHRSSPLSAQLKEDSPPPPVPPRPDVQPQTITTLLTPVKGATTPISQPQSVQGNSPGHNSVSDLEDMVDEADRRADEEKKAHCAPAVEKQLAAPSTPVVRATTPLEKMLSSPAFSTEVSFSARRAPSRVESPIQPVESPLPTLTPTKTAAPRPLPVEPAISALRAKSLSRAESVRDLNERLVHEDPRQAIRRAMAPTGSVTASPAASPSKAAAINAVAKSHSDEVDPVERITSWLRKQDVRDTSVDTARMSTRDDPPARSPRKVSPAATPSPRKRERERELKIETPRTPRNDLAPPDERQPSPSSPTRSMRSPAPKTSPAASPAAGKRSPLPSPNGASKRSPLSSPNGKRSPLPSPVMSRTQSPAAPAREPAPTALTPEARTTYETKYAMPKSARGGKGGVVTKVASKWSDMLKEEESYLAEAENRPAKTDARTLFNLMSTESSSPTPLTLTRNEAIVERRKTVQPRKVSNPTKRWSEPTIAAPVLNATIGKRPVMSHAAPPRASTNGLPPPRSQTTSGIAQRIQQYQASLASLK